MELDKIDEEALEWDLSSSQKKPKQKVGTPFFLAPEAWEDKNMTKKSDIWSLGVVLFEICSMKYPFFATTIEDL